jgi:thioredoxin 1
LKISLAEVHRPRKMIIIEDVKDFKKQVLNDHGLKIVRFCAEWSGPCHIMGPLYGEMFTLYKNSASFYQIDIDQVPHLKMELGVTELPTILFFRNEVVIDFITGLISRTALIEKLEKTINNS